MYTEEEEESKENDLTPKSLTIKTKIFWNKKQEFDLFSPQYNQLKNFNVFFKLLD